MKNDRILNLVKIGDSSGMRAWLTQVSHQASRRANPRMRGIWDGAEMGRSEGQLCLVISSNSRIIVLATNPPLMNFPRKKQINQNLGETAPGTCYINKVYLNVTMVLV